MPARILLLAALCGVSAHAFAQDTTRAGKTSALAGMVRDPTGHPIAGATLSVDNRGLQAVTNDSGQFFLGGIPSGRNDFTLVKLGYAAVHFSVDLSPDSTLVVNIPMRTVQNIAGVEVKGERISAKLLQMGFYDRKKVGVGTFLDNDKVERMAGAQQPSTFLRDVRGIQVRCRPAGRCSVTPTRQGGCLAVFHNKAFVRGELDDAITVGEVYAMEVYERPALVPIEFTLPSRMLNCGVIAVWTRGFAEPSR